MPRFKWYRPGDPIPPLTPAMYRRGLAKPRKAKPHDITAASYNRKDDTLDLTLRNGITICLPRLGIGEIAKASPSEVAKVELWPDEEIIGFPAIDMHIYGPRLITDELASLFAKTMGAKTRGVSTPKKTAASRKNGRKGGRPRKKAA
jgi:hypothetical protein